MQIDPKTPKIPRRLKWPSRPEVFDAFAEWMAYPKSLRVPTTQQGFAKLHEVSPDTLSDYKKKSSFWEKVEDKKIELLKDIENKKQIEAVIRSLSDMSDGI